MTRDAGPDADGGGEAEGDGRLREADPAYNRINSCEGAPEVEFPAAICVCDGLSMIGNLDVVGRMQVGGVDRSIYQQHGQHGRLECSHHPSEGVAVV